MNIENLSRMNLDISLQDLALASLVLSIDEDANFTTVWQNPAAISLLHNYDLTADLELRLLLLNGIRNKTPSSFVYRIENALQAYRFISTPLHQNAPHQSLLLQFFPDHSDEALPYTHQENMYQTLLEASHSGVMAYNVSEDIIHYSEQAYKVLDISHATLGYTLSEFIHFIHLDDVTAFQDALEMHFSFSWPFSQKFRFKTEAGNYCWLHATGQAVRNEAQAVTHFYCSFQNVSEQIYAQELLVQREKLIEQVIDSLPISIYVKDEAGCYRFFSNQTEQETGINRNMAIGRTDYELFPIDIARKQFLQEKIAREDARLVISEEEVIQNGSSRWLLMGCGPINLEKNQTKTKWVIGFSIDITHQKTVEKMLRLAKEDAEKATQAKSDFLSVMSHEIRTPLNSVLGSAQLILDTDLDADQKQHIEMIQRSGEHLLHLINDILDYNKLEANKMHLEQHPFDLLKQVKTVQHICDVNAAAKGVSLYSKIGPSVQPYYLGDEARLNQILINLMGNAVKFTEKGSVTLSIECLKSENKQDWLRFEIIDTGIGIAPENIAKLFSEFSQADTSTTRRFGGTGLGLAICKKLVEAMEGKIGIHSQLGQGSVFWFEVPLMQTDMVSTQAEPAVDVAQTRSLTILVAEDNIPNQLLIKAVLKKFNHQFVVVENGALALAAMQQPNNFDLILMDMQMPEMDGMTATKAIRQLDNGYANIPILALTANALAGDKALVIESGMNDYLAKPIDLKALKQALVVWGNVQWKD